jgi:REP element-mobilizing transposase RayT
MGKKGWHNRGYLPHYDGHGITQHVVIRLHDALPPNEQDGDDVLDRHLGSCMLRDPRCARIVAETLLSGPSYTLQAWCVMPNHVHALIHTNAETTLGQIVRAWKGLSRRRINALLARTGDVWAKDYFDRYIRDQRQLRHQQELHRNEPRRRRPLLHPRSLALQLRRLEVGARDTRRAGAARRRFCA